MRNRQKSLERLLVVKTQLHALEEAKLADIQRRKLAAEDVRRAMFDLLGDEGKTDSFILGLACRHISRTALSERDLDASEQAQKAALLTRSAQKRSLEKIVKEAEQAADRESERRTLLDIGEKLAGKPQTSLP
jgi:hypothetical protein